MGKDCRTAAAVTCRFLRVLGVGGISILALLALAGRADATYLHSQVGYDEIAPNYFNAGDYLDKAWYYLLDEGQYLYLDKAQYNLMGGLSYQLGHPAYPKLFERASEQTVGFTNGTSTAWLGSAGGRVTIIEYPLLYSSFNAGDYIDKARYYFLDRGQYYYLDRDQYNLLGGMGYLFGRSYFQRLSGWDSYYHHREKPGGYPTPEPSTIGFVAVGAFIIFTSRRRSHSFVERRPSSPLSALDFYPKADI